MTFFNPGKKLDNGRITESQESYSGTDEVDGPVRLSSSLQQRILKDPLFFVSMSTEDLELISEFGMENLPNQMNISMDRARLIYDNCERELSRRTDIKETRDLLDLCHKAIYKFSKDYQPQNAKKHKTSND